MGQDLLCTLPVVLQVAPDGIHHVLLTREQARPARKVRFLGAQELEVRVRHGDQIVGLLE